MLKPIDSLMCSQVESRPEIDKKYMSKLKIDREDACDCKISDTLIEQEEMDRKMFEI